MDYIDKKGNIYIDVMEGPKGGLYYVNSLGKKVYIKKESVQPLTSKGSNGHKENGRSSSNDKKSPKLTSLTFTISDYEHEGDIRHTVNYIKKNYPYVTDVSGYEERDYEAEDEIVREYGECEDHIYIGYVTVTLPIDKVKEFEENYVN